MVANGVGWYKVGEGMVVVKWVGGLEVIGDLEVVGVLSRV